MRLSKQEAEQSIKINSPGKTNDYMRLQHYWMSVGYLEAMEAHAQGVEEERKKFKGKHMTETQPWKYKNDFLSDVKITGYDEKVQFIVRAVNSHDALLKSLKILADLCEEHLKPSPGLIEFLAEANKTIDQAEGR